MDAGLMWTAIGTVASGVGAGVAWWQLRLQGRKPPAPSGLSAEVEGDTVRAPTGRLPRVVRGRDQVLDELVKLARRPPGHFVVLSGMGGAGKSTVAATLVERIQGARAGLRRPTEAWWASVADRSSLTGAMATIARRLGAGDADLQAIAAGRPDAPDRVWELLDHAPRRWLLILDNADDPEVLARPVWPIRATSATPSTVPAVGDGDGWVRPSRRGLLVVTSREASPDTWGRHARVVNLDVLDEDDAARVLLDWAPSAGDDAQARSLARRLGRLPLALTLAGSYLASGVALTGSFAEYERNLDRPHDASGLLGAELARSDDPRMVVMQTWELSLDTLARRHVPQARALLRLLSCYAASTPIPLDLLRPERLLPLLAASCGATAATATTNLERGLRHLVRLHLLDAHSTAPRALVVHPAIADTNRAHLAVDTASGIDPDLVRRTSVELVTDALRHLDHEEPSNWARYRGLGPHVHALFRSVATDLDGEHLQALVATTATAAAAHDRSGLVAEGERLTRATFDALTLLDQDDPAALLVRHHFAWETAAQGRPKEAEAIHRDLLERRERVLGPDHPDTLKSRHELAWVAAVQGRWTDAEARYREVLSRRERRLGDTHPDTLMSRHELAWAVASQGRGQEAEKALRDVIEGRTCVLGADHPRTLDSEHELAWALAVQGRWSEAENAYRKVLGSRRRVLGDEHPDALTAAHELAWTVAMQGHQAQAATEYKTVLAARERLLGPEHPDTIATRRALQRLRRGETTPAHHLT